MGVNVTRAAGEAVSGSKVGEPSNPGTAVIRPAPRQEG